MKHKCKPGSPAAILMRGHHASGGETMSRDMGGGIAPRRVAPNMEQKFKKGGHCVEYAREEHLERSSRKKNGISSKRKPREHHFLGALAGALLPHVLGPIGELAGSGIKKLGHLIGLKEGGRAKREHHSWGNIIGCTGMRSNIGNGIKLFKEGGSADEYKKGGRTKRQHHGVGGDIIGKILGGAASFLPFKEGGSTDKKREHHDWGGDLSIPFRNAPRASSVMAPRDAYGNMIRPDKDGTYGGAVFKKGGSTDKGNFRSKKAMGGVGKTRKDYPMT